MGRALVIISGASSGIGQALARAVPFEGARVIDVSRRGAAGFEHVAADLADPEGWRRVDELFAREVRGFSGDRVVFAHCAGTLDPIGFADRVAAPAYTRNVLLNSAAPQVLGAAFLRAAAQTRARCDLLMIGSGAATNVYPGWTSYGAGKAAVNQWVRTAAAEQGRRPDGCTVVSIAPGVVATPMQEQIRGVAEEDFPDVPKFIELHETGALRDVGQVAREIWTLLEKGLENGSVLDLRD